MSGEEWRPAVGFPDYAVSSLGRVKRVVPDAYGRMCGKVMRQKSTKAGYLQCGLTRFKERRSLLVNRLVCEAFHGCPPSTKHHAAHKDGDRANNRADNLRWATPSENELDKRAHGTVPAGDRHHARRMPERMARGSRVGTAKITEEIVILIRADTRKHAEIAAEYGLSRTHVCEIRTRKVWRHVI